MRAIVIAILVLLSQAVSASAETRRALVVGNDDYVNLPKLQKAAGDARALKAALEKLGFEVDLLVNVDRRALNLGISDFAAKLKAGDVALVHFSGHGVALDGENYLLPTDVPKPGSGDKELIKAESLAMSALIDRVRAPGVATRIFIVDACRDNPFANAGQRSFGARGGLVNVQPQGAGGIFIMYSAGFGQTATDRLSDRDPEPTSVYTRTLLRKLTVEGKTLIDIAREVREDVEALAASVGQEQRPGYYDELSGKPFYFVPPHQPAMQMSPEIDMVFWNSIKDGRSAALFRDYLAKFGDNAIFSSIARERIAGIERTTTPDVAASAPAQPAEPATFQPSFDCQAAGDRTEQAVCGSAALAGRDHVLSELYYRRMDGLGPAERTALRAEQRDWMLRRQACIGLDDTGFPDCLERAYDSRIADLEARGGANLQRASVAPSAAPARPSFDCAGNLGPIEQAICADAALAGRDRRLADLYRQAFSRLAEGDRRTLLEGQRGWLTQREHCAGTATAACLAGVYDGRIRDLGAALARRRFGR